MVEVKKILVPTDGSETSKVALDYALELANKFKAELVIINVVDNHQIEPLGTTYYTAELMQKLRDNLMSHAKDVIDEYYPDDREPNVKKHVLQGSPAIEICEFVKTHKIDMIVMGTHGRTGISHMVIGSVAEKVVRLASCPVLTIKPQA